MSQACEACEDGIVPCENCGSTDEHDCVIDGVEYGPYPCPWCGQASEPQERGA